MTLLALLLLSLPADAPIAVPPLEAIEVDAASAQRVRDQLLAALSTHGRRAITAEQQAREGLTTPLLLTGSLGKVGGQLVLGISLADLDRSEVIARAGDSAPSLDALAERLPEVVAALLAPPGRAAPTVALPSSPVFVILELTGAGLPDERARNLVQVVATELRRIEGARVLSKDEVQAMLGAENLRQVLDGRCDRSCFARLAGALDADYVITGSVGVLDTTYVVSLTALDQRSDGRAHRITETYRGSADELLRATRHATQRLFGLGAGTGALAVGGTEGGATVRVDSRELGVLPLPPQSGLAPGRYTVTLEKSGFEPWRSEVYVNPDDTTVLWAELQRRPEAWFEKWWVWTIVGAAVLGGTAGIVAASTAGTPDVGNVAVNVR